MRVTMSSSSIASQNIVSTDSAAFTPFQALHPNQGLPLSQMGKFLLFSNRHEGYNKTSPQDTLLDLLRTQNFQLLQKGKL